MLEIDPGKGGIPFSAHMAEAESHRGQEGMREVVQVLGTHAAQGWVVPWHRIRVFQDISLKLMLAPIVCQKTADYRYSTSPQHRRNVQEICPSDSVWSSFV